MRWTWALAVAGLLATSLSLLPRAFPVACSCGWLCQVFSAFWWGC